MTDVNEALFGFEMESAATADDRRQRLERSNGHALAQIAFNLHWQCENARHHETLVARKFNFWRDILPPELEADLLDRPIGHTARATFAAGELLPPYRDADHLHIRDQAFDRRYRGQLYLEPRVGRFYPRGFIAGTRDIFPGDIRPFRVTSVDEERIGVELNHALAGRRLRVEATILDVWAAGDEHGGRCEDLAEMLCSGGPGMQARWRNRPTDFFTDIPFSRPAPEPDAAFYAMPRLVGHVDRTASAQIARLYRELVPAGGRVLDLMSSAQSHIPQGHAGELTGLGMNAEEMAANPALDSHRLHDLNLQPQLPWEDAAFDAAICSLSVEYLVKPFEVFAEVARVLKPGAPFVVTFSDRWFPPKVTRLWETAHAFERPGIVLEYFLRDGLFEQLQTRSIRGLERPHDDPHVHQRDASDPVFAVWGTRAE